MAPSDIVVAPVHSKSDLAAFIELPNRLYAGHRGYVAPLAVERREALSAKKNPIFQHLEARIFRAAVEPPLSFRSKADDEPLAVARDQIEHRVVDVRQRIEADLVEALLEPLSQRRQVALETGRTDHARSHTRSSASSSIGCVHTPSRQLPMRSGSAQRTVPARFFLSTAR